MENINLKGKKITVRTSQGVIQGPIIDVIPAGKIPTDIEMNLFYGEGWQNKPCRMAQKAMKYDRVLFINQVNNHYIVQVLSTDEEYGKNWSIQL